MAGKSGGKLHEKHQLILANMLREEGNKFCADCHAKGPRWASWNLGVFVCIRCAGIHRNLGVHISRVKSVNLDSWTPEQITTIQKGGNATARDKYEANIPANFRRPQDDYGVEQLIRGKYERKLYISKESPAPVTTSNEARSNHSSAGGRGGKEKKSGTKKTVSQQEQKTDKLLSVPRPPTQHKRSPTPPASNPAPNLISMTTTTSTTTSSSSSPGQPVVDLLTDMGSSSSATVAEASPWQSSPQQPLLGEDPQKAVKDNIMSLYSSQGQSSSGSGQHQAYTTQGFPVNPYHYQQQQMAALRMAQQQQVMAAQQQLAQQQVREVEEKMKQLKVQQGAGGGGGVANGDPFLQPTTGEPRAMFSHQPPGGHTLNPGLW